jgi:hypothetical protein
MANSTPNNPLSCITNPSPEVPAREKIGERLGLEMAKPTTEVDLTQSSFEDFIAFLFDRDLSLESEGRDYWYWHVEVEFDAKKIAAYYVQLFRQPEFLRAQFTKAQLEEGFWAIHGPNLDCSVFRIIDDSEVPLSLREECIRSMADFFRRLFAAEPYDTSVQMWWDSLCYDWECGNRNRERGGEDLNCRIYIFKRLRMCFRSNPGLIRKPLFTAWGIFIIPIHGN